jgi:hypothetical protein
VTHIPGQFTAIAELEWYWCVYPSMVGPPSAVEVLQAVCGGLISSRGREGAVSERVFDAIARAEPIRERLSLLKQRQRRVLRLAYDETLGKDRERLDRVATACRLRGDLTERRLHAEALVGRALRAYCGAMG